MPTRIWHGRAVSVGFELQDPSESRMPEQPRLASPHAALDIGLATDVGRVREGNEDALLAVLADGARHGQVLVAVADGMGGHKAGEVASALAIESLQRALQDADASATAGDAADRRRWSSATAPSGTRRPTDIEKKAWARRWCARCSPPTARR